MTPGLTEPQTSTWPTRLVDYLSLTKPAIVALLLLTTLCGMVIAIGGLPPLPTVGLTLLGGGLTAGGAGALNQYIDRGIDRRMVRTMRRALPDQRLRPVDGLLFGLAMCVVGLAVLAIGVNLLSAILALAGIIYYAVLYSILLKPNTPQNIVVGGGAGAIPPLVGWAAATGSLSLPAFFLFAVIFFWTPPHFWALALLKRSDYARAGIPMLPVVSGELETHRQILLYSFQLVALTALLPLVGLGGGLYLPASLLLGIGLVRHAWILQRRGGNRFAWKMYRYSSLYLAGIFLALAADALLIG